jgi:Lrp/AsnC family leucine-responsive transcriptional regulator
MAHAFHLDKTDFKILKILQHKGDITNLQLSIQVGLSPAPTLERVKKLEQLGFIKGYHAEANAEALGIGIKALIKICLEKQRHTSIEQFKKQVSDIDEVTECYQVTGEADFILKVMVKDIAAFERLITEKFSAIEEIGEMKTMIILSTVKHTNVIPIDYGK